MIAEEYQLISMSSWPNGTLSTEAGKQCIQPGYRAALERLLSGAREVGMIAPAPLPPITPEDQIFEGFSEYLRQERGLRRGLSSPISQSFAAFVRCALRAPTISATSDKSASPATSSATPEMGARDLGSACSGCCTHFREYLHHIRLTPLPLAACVPSIRRGKLASLTDISVRRAGREGPRCLRSGHRAGTVPPCRMRGR